jgi:DNA-binding beta-propeller fold protein YncE
VSHPPDPEEQKLVAINLINNSVQGVYDMPIDWSGKIANNYIGTKIYSFKTEFDAATYAPLWAAIYEFDVETKTNREFYRGVAGSWFYSVGVSPYTGNVYTADVNRFIGNSLLIALDPSGNKIDQKEVGVGTSGMRFMSFIKQ